MQRFQISIKDSEDDDGVVGFDGKVDGVGEGVDGLNADVVITDGRGGGVQRLRTFYDRASGYSDGLGLKVDVA